MTEHTQTCTSCGAMLKPGASFCVKCGQAIPVEPPHPPSQEIPQIPPVPLSPPSPPAAPPPVNPVTPPVFQQSTPVENPPPTPPVQAQAVVPPPPPPPSVPVFPPPPALNGSAEQPGIPPQVPLPPTSETVLHVIGMVSRKTGMFTSIVYHMVLTDQRLIFALQTSEMQKADVNSARQAAKAQGKGFFGQVGAQMSTRSGQKYLSYAPDMILAENPQNFEIPLSQLKVIETYNGNFDDNEPDSMIVKTFSNKLTFVISSAHAVRGELKPFLGSRVK